MTMPHITQQPPVHTAVPAAHAAVPAFLSGGDFTYRWDPAPVFVRAEGIRLHDDQGRVYLDAEAANGTAGLGFDAALATEAARRVAAVPTLPSFCESALRLRVGRRLADRFEAATGAAGRVAFELGGAQGMELAMRIVAANRGNGPVVTFQGSYHGRSPYTAQLSADARYRELLGSGSLDVVRLPYPDCRRCPHRTASGCNPACAESAIRPGRESVTGVPAAGSPVPLAAFILEPLLNVGGMALPDSDHLRRLVDHFRSLGALIVVDEIFTGMYRTGPEWGFQLHGIEPDIIVASKGLTNGLSAFSCVWAREPLAAPDVFPPGTHSSTYAANPWSLAVVDTVLDRYEAWDDREGAVRALSARLTSMAEALAADHPVIAAVQVVGAVARLELSGPYAPQLRAIATDRAATGKPGLLLASTGMAKDVLALHPPLITTEAELALIHEGLDEVLRTFASRTPAA
ncbi:aminotransferase class III-fold pyridoxal phosphate-dependent enzyme [Streptomyces sp. NBC_01565]|uniref:aminotransferase class III-fold pyridoxal phosphate-dependent enzyme n=1 Tax=unclassified Streptomyces TaxID=2593676 RepID=UPI0022559331|nr:aminotransferase class III-fold pyridoxal phosphate-dependent enzyme [Streptomyces sp. NBC_01565]MCX4542425.1 aminotransferase class III-fold pyridoxal phosphate-dependent enzyme [Streptomyces sp. NBC_01565]